MPPTGLSATTLSTSSIALQWNASRVTALVLTGAGDKAFCVGTDLKELERLSQQVLERIRTIGARHEQACGYMAFGYARSSGKPGVFSVVPGPGVLNASAALLTAFGCNEPVMCLTGQVPTNFLGKGRGHLHERARHRDALDRQ